MRFIPLSWKLEDLVEGRVDAMQGYITSEMMLLGMRITDLEALESAADTAVRIHRVMETGSDQFESIHRRKDRSTWNLEISAT